MKRVAWLFLAVAAAACSADERAPCLPGMVRDPGSACTLPPTLDLIVDGRRDDWTSRDALEVLVPGSCCSPGDSAISNAGRQRSDGQLVFFSNVGSSFGTLHVYGLSFSRVDLPEDDPGNVHTLFAASGDGTVETYVDGVRVFGAPAEAALGEGGVEWRLPTTALPYPGVASVQGVTYDLVDGRPTLRRPARSTARVCWDPDAPDDPCRAE